MKKQFLPKLTQYSAACAAFLAVGHGADAQIVYTDIDPDVQVGIDWWEFATDEYLIDMNDDGINDFRIYAVSVSFSSASVLDTYYMNVIALGSNSVAFENIVIFDNYVGGYSSSCGAVVTVTDDITPRMDFGTLVSEDLGFKNGGAYLWADQEYGAFGDYDGCFIDDVFMVAFGEWPFNEGYIGVKLNIDGENHYGYIQAYVDYNYTTIKSYAYNAVPDEPIAAGDIFNCSQTELLTTIITPTAIKYFFSDIDAAGQYRIKYREAGTDTWMKKNSADPNTKITGLECNTEYEYKYQVVCDTLGIIESTAWSPVYTITTGDCRLNTSVDQISLEIFPNPATNYFAIISSNEIAPNIVRVFDVNGKLILEDLTPDTDKKYSVSEFANGVYFVSIIFEDTEIQKMFIIEN